VDWDRTCTFRSDDYSRARVPEEGSEHDSAVTFTATCNTHKLTNALTSGYASALDSVDSGRHDQPSEALPCPAWTRGMNRLPPRSPPSLPRDKVYGVVLFMLALVVSGELLIWRFELAKNLKRGKSLLVSVL
jgi:hypothetical protein